MRCRIRCTDAEGELTSAGLLVAWRETPDQDPADAKADLVAEFIARHAALPFAHRVSGRGTRVAPPHGGTTSLTDE